MLGSQTVTVRNYTTAGRDRLNAPIRTAVDTVITGCAMQPVSVTFHIEADIVQPLAQVEAFGRIDQNTDPVVADIEQFTLHPLDMQAKVWHRKGCDPINLSFFGVFFRDKKPLRIFIKSYTVGPVRILVNILQGLIASIESERLRRSIPKVDVKLVVLSAKRIKLLFGFIKHYTC